MNTLKILIPTAEVEEISLIASTIPELSGKVVGFVSNEIWKCLAPTWKKFDEVLRSKYGVAETFKVVISAAHETPAEDLDATATKSDAAIVGLGG